MLAASFIVLASFTMHKKTAPGAQPYNVQSTWDRTGEEFYDPCTGEWVVLSGTEHVDLHGVYNSKDGSITDQFHGNFQGMSATGETTGNTYQITGAGNQKTSSTVSGCITQTYIETVNYTTAGSNNNYYEKIREVYTVNLCTGEFTVTRDLIDEGCR